MGVHETSIPIDAFYFKWISTAAYTSDNFVLDYKSGKFFNILLVTI